MPTPERLAAGDVFRSDGVCPFNPDAELPADAHPLDPQKVPHFGYMGRIIDQGTQDFFQAHQSDPSRIGSTRTPRALAHAIVATYHDVFAEAGEDVLADEWDYIEASQQDRQERVPGRWKTPEEDLKAGYFNFATLSMPLLFDGLKQVYGLRNASQPDNWPLLRDMASLNPPQLNAFGNHYLLSRVAELPKIITETARPDGSRRLRFHSQFPAKTPIHHTLDTQFLTPLGSETFDMGDLKADGPTIGCPIIFTPKHVRDLWALYAGERRRIDTE